MTSKIAWLDASSEEQRRMRDIIRLFSDRESRDELGLGQVRDALSDGLFPGTSTLHTRARYLLFVPWIYQDVAGRSDSGRRADNAERKLIEALKKAGDTQGLLGAQAGTGLKNLPSSIYWSALRQYGILANPGLSRSEALLRGAANGQSSTGDGLNEETPVWSPTIPAQPDEFPRDVPGGFALRPEEATWLRDRILDTAKDTLLAHLVVERPSPDSKAPWEDESARSACPPASDLLDLAHRFSTVMHGAQLLYNLLLAEEYEKAGLDRVSDPVDGYRQELATWADRMNAVDGFDTGGIRQLFYQAETVRGAPLNPLTTRFVGEWIDVVNGADLRRMAEHDAARDLITKRERRNKGALARIGHPKRLQNWTGGSGSRRLTYRWDTVLGVLLDIHTGMEGAQDA
ncbi:MAG: DUF6361 family protein [Galactobacter sp.]